MEKRYPVLFTLLFSGAILLIFLVMQPVQVYLGWDLIAVLFPKGWVAREERDLLLFIQALMLLVVIPVYFLTFFFSWKYRAGNKKAKHEPEGEDYKLAEFIWWGLPFLLILIIGGVTWVKTHELDPYKPIASEEKPMRIQAVALQWKWLFIYPEEGIASVNYLQFPVDRPVHFEITADAPMNALWIPQLAGMIYAMPKMRTELNLIADKEGDYRGSSANISGEGFAGMHFIARASSDEEYQNWVGEMRGSSESLSWENYPDLAKPSSYVPPVSYQLGTENLFEKIIQQYLTP